MKTKAEGKACLKWPNQFVSESGCELRFKSVVFLPFVVLFSFCLSYVNVPLITAIIFWCKGEENVDVLVESCE